MNKDKCKVLTAAEIAAVSNVSHLTNDRIEALAGGHGMVNIAVHTVANAITEELLGGGSVSIKFADVRHLPVETILKKAIQTAKDSGADGANAALITAMLFRLSIKAIRILLRISNDMITNKGTQLKMIKVSQTLIVQR